MAEEVAAEAPATGAVIAATEAATSTVVTEVAAAEAAVKPAITTGMSAARSITHQEVSTCPRLTAVLVAVEPNNQTTVSSTCLVVVSQRGEASHTTRLTRPAMVEVSRMLVQTNLLQARSSMLCLVDRRIVALQLPLQMRLRDNR